MKSQVEYGLARSLLVVVAKDYAIGRALHLAAVLPMLRMLSVHCDRYAGALRLAFD